MKRWRIVVLVVASASAVPIGLWGAGVDADQFYRWSKPLRDLVRPLTNDLRGRKTVEERLDEYGSAVEARLHPAFDRVELAYPPAKLVLAAFKSDDRLEMYARDEDSPWRLVKRYPILAASGTVGPKLREGDRQVPEGLYDVEGLNPNSSYHLSIKLSYPNALDRKLARRHGRSDPGGNIFIHGRDVSIGCLAMGDEAAEELFVVIALTGREHVSVVVSPVDFRTTDGLPKTTGEQPDWIERKYQRIRDRLEALPLPRDATVDHGRSLKREQPTESPAGG